MELNFATISALIGVLGGILGILNQLHNLRKEQTENIKAQAVREQQLDDKLREIDSKLQSHNQYAEKFASLTNTIVAMQTDIKWIKESKV
jgi:hypothetical protein